MAETIQCGLCGAHLKRITQTHLDSAHPGMTLEDYRQTYGATSARDKDAALVLAKGEHLADTMVQRIKDDPALMEDIAKRVGQTLFSAEYRGKFLGAVLVILQRRLASYGAMNAKMDAVSDELFRPERIRAGGPFGAPTDTATLIQMGRLARDSATDAEDALLRMVKLAVDDSKAPEIKQTINLFSGRHETIIVPNSFTPKQREGLRRLATRLVRSPTTVRAMIEKVDKAKLDEATEAQIIEGGDSGTLDE